jgi:hypothetical protein
MPLTVALEPELLAAYAGSDIEVMDFLVGKAGQLLDQAVQGRERHIARHFDYTLEFFSRVAATHVVDGQGVQAMGARAGSRIELTELGGLILTKVHGVFLRAVAVIAISARSYPLRHLLQPVLQPVLHEFGAFGSPEQGSFTLFPCAHFVNGRTQAFMQNWCLIARMGRKPVSIYNFCRKPSNCLVKITIA